jgi:DNA invertase Pin-like site-specific DNA recombinase
VNGGQRIGYARVSTRQQDVALQLADMQRAGCERIFRDVGSGTIRRRPQLDACLDYLRPADTLVVWRLDRLGRSLHHLIDVMAQLERRDIVGGRPRKLTPEKAAAALAMRDRGDMTMSQIARALGVGRTTLYDHLDLPPLDRIPREHADNPTSLASSEPACAAGSTRSWRP